MEDSPFFVIPLLSIGGIFYRMKKMVIVIISVIV